MLDAMLKVLDLNLSANLGVPLFEAIDGDLIADSFILSLKNIWADNGDYLSLQYTGTGSTHSDAIRTGKRDINGMLSHGKKTLFRFY